MALTSTPLPAITFMFEILLNLIIKNSGSCVNPQVVIERAKRALIEKQSLFTMQAK